jgi:hypothetical protein
MFIREGIRSVEDLKLSAADKRKIYFGNALKLLGMKAPAEKRAAPKKRKPARKKK